MKKELILIIPFLFMVGFLVAMFIYPNGFLHVAFMTSAILTVVALGVYKHQYDKEEVTSKYRN